ncbi:MAG TPA: hypothetical protein V6C81_32100 [Planktothrix sp.]|jgi:hypothetical protein
MEEQAKRTAADNNPPSSASAQEQSANKAPLKDKLQLVQNMLAITGMVGTLFVWGAANFYVGDVEIVPNRGYQNISIQVFDRKGQETTYHNLKFQLMPGMYHIEVTADGSAKYPADIEVQFAQKRQLLVALGNPSATPPAAPQKEQQPQEQPAQTTSEVSSTAPPLPAQWASTTQTQLKTEAKPEQVSSESQSEGSQQSDGDGHHHWWQFRHKKVD